MKKLCIIFIFFLISSSVQAQLIAKRQPATLDALLTLEISTGGNLEEILWYISDPIEIERLREVQNAEGQAEIKALQEKGKLKIVGGKYYEIARFTPGATGLLEYKKDDVIAIRYEHEEGRFLEFELGKVSDLETVQYYKLKVKKDDPKKLSGGKVFYAGTEWDLISGSRATLEFKAKGNTGAKVQKTKVKGLRKDGTERGGLKFPKKKN